MKRIILFFGIAITSLFIINSCATTKLNSVWMDDKYQEGALKNVLVIGVIEPQILRNYFENELVKQLKAKGTDAFASNKIFPDETMPKKHELRKKIKEMNIDSVLVVRLADVSDINAYMTYPPQFVTSEGFYGYYTLCCQNIVSLGYNVKFETKIFMAKNDNLVWSALSVTDFDRSPQNMTRSLIEAIINDLSNRKLLK
ncbi:MAG: hypothetical protein FJ240_04475 [Nitrospira sp.]|nr:hypothetical protein [Nitrospira sp.]